MFWGEKQGFQLDNWTVGQLDSKNDLIRLLHVIMLQSTFVLAICVR